MCNKSLRGEYLTDIQMLIKHLRKQTEENEWSGKPFKHLQDEHDRVVDYHTKTGSLYYPLF